LAEVEERFDNLKYEKEDTGGPNDGAQIANEPFISGPAEFLVQEICRQLKQVPQWAKIFGDFIDPYKRMDYEYRNLPAMRVYNDEARKEFESWFIDGDIFAEIILPAYVRRNDLQQIQDTLSMALLQQFRRPTFFDTMATRVPGLNQLGKSFSVDKALGLEWGDGLVPLTRIRINFRLDLRVWDDYLEQTDRTKDSPFEAILGNLENLATTIQGLKEDSDNAEVTLGIDQDLKTTGE
jgi:hypothetical protein